MMSKDSAQDQELLERYRRASASDAAAPSDAVRAAILAESRRVAAQLANHTPLQIHTSRPAANDSRWKISVFGTVGATLLAALLFAPHYFESVPTAPPQTFAAKTAQVPNSPVPATQLSSAQSAAPAPKMQSNAPARRRDAESAHQSVQQAERKSANASSSNSAQRPLAAPSGVPPDPAQDRMPSAVPPAPLANAPSALSAPSIQGGLSGRASIARNQFMPADLQSAAASGDATRTTLLLNQGAVVDARDAAGRTPLMLAVMQNRPEIVRLLLARGANPNIADNAGRTPLQLAGSKNLQDIAGLLKRAGAR